jgi:hypothetical protein
MVDRTDTRLKVSGTASANSELNFVPQLAVQHRHLMPTGQVPDIAGPAARG